VRAPTLARTAAGRFDARVFAEAAALGASASRIGVRGRRPMEGALGAHGRRRAGPGAAFWQYRPYQPEESARQIDWRRTARGDLAIVREREWEAALTLDIWIDHSPSMNYPSAAAADSKRRAGDVIGLAAAAAWLKRGERVRVLGDPKRGAVTSLAGMARALARAGRQSGLDLPPPAPAARDGFVLLIGDFQVDPAAFAERVEALARFGARGVAVQVLHAHETELDYAGRIEFQSMEAAETHLLRHVESGRESYQARMKSHRAALVRGLARAGWSLTAHRSDRPHAPPLTAALAALGAGGLR